MLPTICNRRVFRFLKPSFLFAVLWILGGLASHSVQATSFHTLTIDGLNDFASDEDFATSSVGYTAYATWDAANLYLGANGADIGSGESANKWVVWYFDTDPQCVPTTGSGTTTAIPFNTQNWTLPFRADYMLQIRTDEGFNQLNRWNGSAWVASGLTASIFDNDGANYLELRLPLSDLGTPTQIRAVGYFINQQGGSEWTYGSWPDNALSGGDGYKAAGSFVHWYGYTLATAVAPDAPANYDYLFPRLVNTTTGKGFCTIQAGVNDATTLNGHTLAINPGTFAENVTVSKSLTLDGAGAGTNPAIHTILEGVGRSGSGILINNGITNVTIQDLRVQNYNTTAGSSGISAQGNNNNFTVQNVHVVNNGVAGNSTAGVYMNGPVNNVLITNVTATNNRTRGIVIWNGLKTNITITNNNVQNNNCCGIELQDGGASGVTISNNTIIGNTDSGMAALGLRAGSGPNVIANNILQDNGRFGIEIKMPNGTGLASGDGSIVLSNNSVSRTVASTDQRDYAGISVIRRGWTAGQGYVDIPTGVIVQNNTISGYRQTTAGSFSTGFGIAVEGTNMTVTGNTLNNNDVGVQLQAGHLPYTANSGPDGDQSNLNDNDFGRGNSPVGCATISGNNFAGNSVNSRSVGAVGGGTVSNLNTGKLFCSIQTAVNDATTLNGHTLNVPAATFVENVTINKSLTLAGAGPGNTIVYPAISNPNCGGAGGGSLCAGSSNIFLVQADNVIIHGFTLNGDNPSLTSGTVVGGADLDARNGLITNHTAGVYNNLEVYNTTIQNIYLRGLYASSGGTFNFHDNTVQNVQADPSSIAIMNFGGVGVFTNNSVSTSNAGIVANNSKGTQFLNNQVTTSPGGIHTDNNGSSGGVADLIQGNTVTNCGLNGYGVWVFAPYFNTVLNNNTITNCDVAMAAAGSYGGVAQITNNTATGTSAVGGAGLYVTTSLFGFGSANLTVNVQNNTFSNHETGFYLEVDNAANSLNAAIVNNTISNNGTAVQTAGVAGNHTVRLAGNNLSNNTVVFNHALGSIQAYANNVTGFTNAGLTTAAGTFDARHNWWGAHFAIPAGVDATSWTYRLGALVQTWSEGVGTANLADSGNGLNARLSGGTGTAVIVSHGRPTTVAQAPFNNGVSGFYDQMCSDFYDMFVINTPGGLWTASVPLDGSAGCATTLANKSIFWIPFGTDYNVECTPSTNANCWDLIPPASVVINGGNLDAVNLTVGDLSGTPIVAGSDTSQDPTAVTLHGASAGQRPSHLPLIALTVAGLGLTCTYLYQQKKRGRGQK